MKTHAGKKTINRCRALHTGRQQGVVLFFALISMVVIMLAAVGMLRSADTATLIAGNIASRQGATSAGDAGIEQAIAWVATQSINNPGDPAADAMQFFNISKPSEGYYSFVNPNPNFVKDDTTWTNANSKLLGKDLMGNEIRYIVQRMCRVENQVLSAANCLYSDGSAEGDSQQHNNQDRSSSLSPVMRITVRVSGPKNALSYIQGFVY